MPPNYLFTWVGLRNLKICLQAERPSHSPMHSWRSDGRWSGSNSNFYNLIGGILLAKLINHENTYFKKMWRSLFVVTIAIPQFVTLLLVSKMFADHGIVNTWCSNIGLTGFLKDIGLVSGNFIPFLSKPGWSHVMIILINIWLVFHIRCFLQPVYWWTFRRISWRVHESMEPINGRFSGRSPCRMYCLSADRLWYRVWSPTSTTSTLFICWQVLQLRQIWRCKLQCQGRQDLLITWLFTLTNDNSNYKMHR